MSRYFVGFSDGIHQTQWLDREVWLIIQPWGELVIAKVGAQILHYQPIAHQPVFWVNTQESVVTKELPLNQKPTLKVITERGGVPLCWPWFAENESDASLPFHGLARNALWALTDKKLSCANNENNTCLEFSPCESLSDVMSVTFQVVINSNFLKMNLITHNISDKPQYLTQALHSYFSVSNSEKITLSGLKDSEYFDKLDGMECKKQPDELVDIKAIDNIYKHQGVVVLKDEGLSREIIIDKKNSASTVVWNPSSAAPSLNITKDPKGFICVEAANTTYEAFFLQPQESICLEQTITVQHL